MKKLLFILLIVATLLIAASCSPAGEASERCPSETTNQKLLTNEEDGYCLLYPVEAVALSPRLIAINPVNAGDAIGDAAAFIDVEDDAGRTASAVADKLIADTGPGFNITRTDTTISGETAVVIDGLPGPDPWRKVVVVHNNRLYTLTFMPWPQNGNLQNLYTNIVDSFHFLP